MSRPPIRVLVVDDSAFARKVIREVLAADPRFSVVGIARDGLDALEKIAELAPDVVTLDLVMPNLDGLGVLRALPTLSTERRPGFVIVSMTEGDSDLAVAALQSGAVDLVHKPTSLATDRLFELSDELRTKVASAAEARILPTFDVPPSQQGVGTDHPERSNRRRLVAIGTSTGGPQALTALLGAIPADFPAAVAVVLHIPVGYTAALARRLDATCAIEVLEAYDGIELRPGRAVIARAGMHLKVEPGAPPHGRLDIAPIQTPHRPSVDVLLASAADALGDACIGVVLTGMGDDGLEGARALRAKNAVVLTEAESSCVVYGMPRSIEVAGLSSAVVPLDRMLEAIFREL